MIVVIANPGSGSARRAKVEAHLREACAVFSSADETRVVETFPDERTEETARMLGGARLVVAAGGDGTVRRAAEHLLGSGTPLGILPLGTENVLARFLGLPANPAACARRILQGNERTLDAGSCGGKIFLSFLGIGLDAHVVAKTPSSLKKKIGGFSYAAVALKECLAYVRGSPLFRISGGDFEFEGRAWLFLAGNIPFYGWRVPIFPGADPSDGKLDGCLFPKSGIIHPGKIIRCRFEKISIAADRPVPIQADGDLIGETPCDVSVIPGALRVRV